MASVQAAKPAEFKTDPDAKDEETPPDVDATLDEAENILADYIKLLASKNLLSSKEQGVHGP